MKKKCLTGVGMILIAGILMAGCGKSKDDNTQSSVVPETKTIESQASETEIASQETEVVDNHEGMAKSLLTGEWISEELAGQRPVAIMTENTKVTLPQYGVSNADIIYECPVEGGITRLLACYQDYSGMEKIGNVRSSRNCYIYLAKELDAIYVHAGGSTYAYEVLDTGYIDHIDGITGKGGKSFYRDSSRKAPHNLYTTSEKLASGITSAGFSTELDSAYADGHFKFAEDDAPVTLANGSDAAVVSLYYQNPKPWFEYHEEDGLYYRYEFGSAQVDGANNEQLAVKNIIIQYHNISKYDSSAGYLDIDLVGSGSGKYITNGKVIDITWKKDSLNGITHYYDTDGNEITLNQGKSWIAVCDEAYAGKNVIYSTKEEFNK